jgi:hypothetical protein
VLPTGNRTGSVRVYLLATKKIVTRDRIRVLPMPMSVVAHLNELAMQEGRSVLRRHHRGAVFSPYDTPLTSRTTLHPLPDFITPTPHSGTDPELVLRNTAPISFCDTHLADESGLDQPAPASNVSESERPTAGGGVTVSSDLPSPILENP